MESPVLFIAAHPDDETLAMSVAIAEHVAAGQNVNVLWLTNGENSSVLNVLNGEGYRAWWGIPHNPEYEGYNLLTKLEFGHYRVREAVNAVKCLSTNLSGHLVGGFGGKLIDGAVSVSDAKAAILNVIQLITLEGPVRLKTHTWHSNLEVHPDHLAAGAAVRELAQEDPSRFSDTRFYLLPKYWGRSASGIEKLVDFPTDEEITSRVLNACKAFGAWSPPNSFGIGMHSVPTEFDRLINQVKCVFHT